MWRIDQVKNFVAKQTFYLDSWAIFQKFCEITLIEIPKKLLKLFIRFKYHTKWPNESVIFSSFRLERIWKWIGILEWKKRREEMKCTPPYCEKMIGNSQISVLTDWFSRKFSFFTGNLVFHGLNVADIKRNTLCLEIEKHVSENMFCQFSANFPIFRNRNRI